MALGAPRWCPIQSRGSMEGFHRTGAGLPSVCPHRMSKPGRSLQCQRTEAPRGGSVKVSVLSLGLLTESSFTSGSLAVRAHVLARRLRFRCGRASHCPTCRLQVSAVRPMLPHFLVLASSRAGQSRREQILQCSHMSKGQCIETCFEYRCGVSNAAIHPGG